MGPCYHYERRNCKSGILEWVPVFLVSCVPSLPYFTSLPVWVSFSRPQFDIWFHSIECDVCRSIPISECYYGCLTCKGELHIRIFSQVHPCVFIYIAQIDICASCYTNKDPSALEIEDHKLDHPLVKWTLNSPTGQRRWTESEAKAVLEDLRTDVQVEDQAGDTDEDDDDGDEQEEEEGGNEEEGRAMPRSYTCGRCSGSIDLDSTFYRCVGHSCRGALMH